MNRKCLLLIPLFFSSVIITACDNKPAVKTTMEPEVGVVTLAPSSVNIKSELPGRALAFEIAEIRPQVGGIIIKRNFVEGDKVSKGESLYQIDPAPLQARLDSAKGALAKAQATANNVRLTLNRQSALIQSNYVSRQDYDTTRSQLNEAQANVAVAKADLEQATINLRYANVTSPIDGISGKSSVTVGALVTANQENSLVTVQRLDPIYVDLTQSVQDFLRLKEEKANGKIAQQQGRIPVELMLDETTGSVTLRAVFPNPEGEILPGMYVTALLDEGSQQNVLMVPQQGITHNEQGKATALILDQKNVVQLREINAVKAVGNQWLVTAGLRPGDRVIVSGLQRIRPGSKARVLPSKLNTPDTVAEQ